MIVNHDKWTHLLYSFAVIFVILSTIWFQIVGVGIYYEQYSI